MTGLWVPRLGFLRPEETVHGPSGTSPRATIGVMEFLMADGTSKHLAEVSSAEVEHGILVCRNATGDIVRTFARSEVVAFGTRLKLKDSSDRRSGGR